MNYKFSKTKKVYMPMRRAFTMIELLIVLAIIAIMTGALFVRSSNGKAASDVESASRQVASQIRALQNEALNGKQIGGVNVCYYKFDVSGSTYNVSYAEKCDGSTAALGTQNTDLAKKKVAFTSSVNMSFTSPQGSVNQAQTITLKSPITNPTSCASVSVSASGAITETKNVTPCT